MYKTQLKKFVISARVKGWDSTNIWTKCAKLAITLNTANLGQGFPDWNPPEFLIESMMKHIKDGNHQYTRSFGTLDLCKAIAKNYSKSYNRELDPNTEVLVSSGGVASLYNSLSSLLDPNDEVVLIEPFYDCYLPQLQMIGGKAVGVPMIPPAKGSTNNI